MDEATAVDGTEYRPEPGCPSICLRCGTVLVFTEQLELRTMTAAELAELDPETRVQIDRAVLAQRAADPLELVAGGACRGCRKDSALEPDD